jgi:hypothetical protein
MHINNHVIATEGTNNVKVTWSELCQRYGWKYQYYQRGKWYYLLVTQNQTDFWRLAGHSWINSATAHVQRYHPGARRVRRKATLRRDTDPNALVFNIGSLFDQIRNPTDGILDLPQLKLLTPKISVTDRDGS